MAPHKLADRRTRSGEIPLLLSWRSTVWEATETGHGSKSHSQIQKGKPAARVPHIRRWPAPELLRLWPSFQRRSKQIQNRKAASSHPRQMPRLGMAIGESEGLCRGPRSQSAQTRPDQTPMRQTPRLQTSRKIDFASQWRS